MSNRVIAIDGPAGSGKSTTARLVAEKLGFVYLDTGAMYRSVTLIALRNEISPSDGVALTAFADRIYIEFRHENGVQRTLVDGEDVTDAIRTPEVTAAVSEVSAHADVRAVLVKRQQEYAQKSDRIS
jgi:cytidylate kinase